jgi:hypothetical protein
MYTEYGLEADRHNTKRDPERQGIISPRITRRQTAPYAISPRITRRQGRDQGPGTRDQGQ